MINRKYETLYFSGPTRDYLVQPTGPPTQDLLAQAREGLQTRLRGAIHRAIREDRPVTVCGARVRRDSASHAVTFTVEPLKGPREAEGLLLVSFVDESDTAADQKATGVAERSGAAEDSVERSLEHELRTTREDLQSTIEELETSNEELKASNEEVMSVNEELQSTNEELETSKEELQSLNEELSTVNSQLEAKIEELERTNSDLDNLLTSTNVPTVFVNRQFCIRRYTPAATRLFNLIASDLGRPLADITQKFTDPDLLPDAEAVLATLRTSNKTVEDHDGRCYVRQILPYRTHDDRIEGCVITFSDVAAEAIEEARLYAEAIVHTVREALVVLDGDLRVVSANESFYRTLSALREETEGRLFHELGNREWDVPQLRSLLSDVLPREKILTDFEVTRDTAGTGTRTMLLNARVLSRPGARPDLILLAIEDVTDRRRAEKALRESEAGMAAILDTAVDAILTIDEGGTILTFNRAAERIFGFVRTEAIGRNVSMLMPPPFRDEHDRYLQRYVRTREARIIGKGRELVGRRKDGTTFPMELAVSEYHDGNGLLFTGMIRDITARKDLEKAVASRMSEEQQEFSRELHDGVAQHLAAIGMSAASLHRRLAAAGSPQAADAARLGDLIRGALEKARALIKGVRPVDVIPSGLSEALQDLAASVSDRYGVACTLETDGDVTLKDSQTATQLYYIATEAVHNAIKHASPERIVITLEAQGCGLLLRVMDDGAGIVPDASPEGVGLQIMSYRASLIGGMLDIRPAEGGGTLVTCTVPRVRRASPGQ